MKILAVDTSSMMGSVAVLDNEELVAESFLNTFSSYSERLLVTIDQMLKHSDLEIGDIDGYAVALGPGSFTGLRIGLATVKGLAVSTGKGVVGVSSLLSLAYNACLFCGVVVPMIDARRGEVYTAAYKFDGGREARTLMDECSISPEFLCRELNKYNDALVLVGDGFYSYKDVWQKELGSRIIVPPASVICPHAGNIAVLARHAFEKGNVKELADIVPNYIRKSDAEKGETC